MEMKFLGKFFDKGNTFENKAMSVFLTFVLVFSCVNVTAFAALGDAASNGDAATQATEDGVEASNSEGTAATEGDSQESGVATEEDSSSSKAATTATGEKDSPKAGTVSEPENALSTDTAWINLELEHAYVVYPAGETVVSQATGFAVPYKQELVVQVFADTDYTVNKVALVNEETGAQQELNADDAHSRYTIPAEYATNNYTLKVTTAKEEAKKSESSRFSEQAHQMAHSRL